MFKFKNGKIYKKLGHPSEHVLSFSKCGLPSLYLYNWKSKTFLKSSYLDLSQRILIFFFTLGPSVLPSEKSFAQVILFKIITFLKNMIINTLNTCCSYYVFIFRGVLTRGLNIFLSVHIRLVVSDKCENGWTDQAKSCCGTRPPCIWLQEFFMPSQNSKWINTKVEQTE